MTQPLVSVVIPTYNHGRFIEGCIESVIAQTLRDWELIVVDDGSTDDTPAIVDRLMRSHADRPITYCRVQGPSGTSVPLNHGTRRSRGRYVAWLSSDDYFAPEKLARQIEVMENAPDCALSFTSYRLIDEVGKVERDIRGTIDTDDLLGELLGNSYAINGSTVVMRRDWLCEVGPFVETDGRYPDIWRVNDFSMWLVAALRGDRTEHLPDVLHVTRAHEDNSYYSRVNISHLLVKIAIRRELESRRTSFDPPAVERRLAEFGLARLMNPSPDPIEYLYEQTELFKFNLFAGKAYVHRYIHNARQESPELAEIMEAARRNFNGDFAGCAAPPPTMDRDGLLGEFQGAIMAANRESRRITESDGDLLLPSLDYIENVNEAYRLGSVLKRKGRAEIAARLFQRALGLPAREPEKFHAGAHFHLGELSDLAGDSAGATAHFERCLTLNPAHSMARKHLR